MNAEMGMFSTEERLLDTDRDISSVVACVCENRAREVCIAVMRSNGAELETYVFADSHSYIETISTIQNIEPDEVLLHDGSRSSILSKKIEVEASSNLSRNTDSSTKVMRIVYMSRSYFDQDLGSAELSKVVAGDVDADLAAKYTVLAASYCLLRYLENITKQQFASHSLRITFKSGVADRMAIDRRSTVALELISCLRDGNQKSSLFGYLNCTQTKAGARLLRANIVRPLIEKSTISMRQAVVAVLFHDNHTAQECRTLLKKMPDIDLVLAGFCKVPSNVTDKVVAKGINTVLMLRDLLSIASSIAEALNLHLATGEEEYENSVDWQEAAKLLKAILETLVPFGASGGSLMNEINSMFDTKVAYESKGKSDHAECFALRQGICGSLDIARVNLIDSLDHLSLAAETYAANLGCSVKITSSVHRGYYLHVHGNAQLPPEFLQVSQTSYNKLQIKYIRYTPLTLFLLILSTILFITATTGGSI